MSPLYHFSMPWKNWARELSVPLSIWKCSHEVLWELLWIDYLLTFLACLIVTGFPRIIFCRVTFELLYFPCLQSPSFPWYSIITIGPCMLHCSWELFFGVTKWSILQVNDLCLGGIPLHNCIAHLLTCVDLFPCLLSFQFPCFFLLLFGMFLR